jgi:hypothetical protein
MTNSMLEKASVGFQVLIAAVVKNNILRNITPCIPLKISRRFEGTCCLHLQGRRINRAINQREERWQAELWRRRQYVLPKCLLIFNGLHGVISQKIRTLRENFCWGGTRFESRPVYWVDWDSLSFSCVSKRIVGLYRDTCYDCLLLTIHDFLHIPFGVVQPLELKQHR